MLRRVSRKLLLASRHASCIPPTRHARVTVSFLSSSRSYFYRQFPVNALTAVSDSTVTFARSFAAKASAKNKKPSIELDDLMESYAIDLSECMMDMEAYLDTYKGVLVGLKEGRPSPDIFDHVKVRCYGADDTPLPSVAQVASLGGTKLSVTVFDPTILKHVSKAIAECGMDLNPQDNGDKLIIDFPKSTKESRQQLYAQAKTLAETTRNNIRQVRQKTLNELKKAKASKDEENESKTVIQVLTDRYIDDINALLKAKETELA